MLSGDPLTIMAILFSLAYYLKSNAVLHKFKTLKYLFGTHTMLEKIVTKSSRESRQVKENWFNLSYNCRSVVAIAVAIGYTDYVKKVIKLLLNSDSQNSHLAVHTKAIKDQRQNLAC